MRTTFVSSIINHLIELSERNGRGRDGELSVGGKILFEICYNNYQNKGFRFFFPRWDPPQLSKPEVEMGLDGRKG